MTCCPWTFQHTSPENKSTSYTSISLTPCLGRAASSTVLWYPVCIHIFSVISATGVLCFPLPCRTHAQSKHSCWTLSPWFPTPEIFFGSSLAYGTCSPAAQCTFWVCLIYLVVSIWIVFGLRLLDVMSILVWAFVSVYAFCFSWDKAMGWDDWVIHLVCLFLRISTLS